MITSLTRIWDWVDKREIDKHVISAAILYGTINVLAWAMHYAATNTDKAGSDVALVIAAVTAPYMALQAAAIRFYFDARTPT